jgi:hypothetical protein
MIKQTLVMFFLIKKSLQKISIKQIKQDTKIVLELVTKSFSLYKK